MNPHTPVGGHDSGRGPHYAPGREVSPAPPTGHAERDEADGLNERSTILCRTCMRPLTWETRTEPGFKPRTGFYDDARSDPLICFKAVSYRHEPLTDREWAYYEAGQRSVFPPGSSER